MGGWEDVVKSTEGLIEKFCFYSKDVKTNAFGWIEKESV